MRTPAVPMKYALADAILGLTYDNIDQAAHSRAKHIILYHSWLCFFALKQKDPEIDMGFAVVREAGVGEGPCTVIGHPFKTHPVDASYLNCHLMRGAGYDDVVFPAGMHAALMVVPTALALAEQLGRSGREFLAAIVTGYEILGNVGRWSWSSETPRRPSTVFGPMATAAVAAQLLRLDREQTANALGYAAHSAMGLAANLCTHIYGMLCRAGILSALYGKAGGTCPLDILEGPLGFYRTYFDAAPTGIEDLLGKGFGKDYAVFMSREKRYPGTLLNTVAIEQMRKLVLGHALNHHNVERVEVVLSNRRERHPTAHLRAPYRTPIEASASCPFQMALLLIDGDLNFERYDKPNDPEVLAVADRIEFSFEDRPNPVYAKVSARTCDGRLLSSEADDHEFAPLDAREEFERHAGHLLTPRQITDFVVGVEGLEEVTDLNSLFSQLTPLAGR